MKRKKRIQPRAEVERGTEVQQVNVVDVPLECISIREWHKRQQMHKRGTLSRRK